MAWELAHIPAIIGWGHTTMVPRSTGISPSVNGIQDMQGSSPWAITTVAHSIRDMPPIRAPWVCLPPRVLLVPSARIGWWAQVEGPFHGSVPSNWSSQVVLGASEVPDRSFVGLGVVIALMLVMPARVSTLVQSILAMGPEGRASTEEALISTSDQE